MSQFLQTDSYGNQSIITLPNRDEYGFYGHLSLEEKGIKPDSVFPATTMKEVFDKIITKEFIEKSDRENSDPLLLLDEIEIYFEQELIDKWRNISQHIIDTSDEGVYDVDIVDIVETWLKSPSKLNEAPSFCFNNGQVGTFTLQKI